MDPLLASLNPRQRDAVAAAGGALVLAGAGTGKTRVLAGRIAWLLHNDIAQPRNILAVTFTNKAAREMRQRVENLLRRPAAGLLVGTFHGVCHKLLRVHHQAASLPRDFQILDAQDQLNFIRRLLRDNQVSDEEFPPAEVRGYINAAKESGRRADAVPTEHPRHRQMAEIYALYEAAAKREGRVDFAELLLAATELLRGDQNLRQHYAARFRHILADEFQDTNRLQYDWLKLLDSGDNTFFAVGDDDQSIYAFRGAEPAVMQRFRKDFRAEKMVRLERNYRSTANILAAANELISQNKTRLGKTLEPAAEADGARVTILHASRADEEAAAVADVIRRKRSDGANLNGVAALYRMNAQSRLLERKLTEAGVPYRIYGGLRFFERMEVKNALAYLRLAAGDDDDALLRAINAPPRGIGPRAIEDLRAKRPPTLCDAAWNSDAPKVARFAALVRELREIREDENSGLGALARAVVEKSGLLEHLESRPKERDRADNLREFAAAAAEFEREHSDDLEGGELGADAVLAFLANASLEAGDERAEGGAAEAANLMTVHSAKGLEFDSVFVCGLEEGVFPHSRSLDSGAESGLEEERRLMYVAMTRARRELFLCFADERQLYGGISRHPPSRFLDEIPKERLANPEALRRPQWTPESSDQSRSSQPFSHRGNGSGRVAGSRVVAGSPRKQNLEWGAQLEKHSGAAGVSNFPRQADGDGAKNKLGSLRPGRVVAHAKYGRGVVTERTGTGAGAEIKVAFKTAGIRAFKAALAKLEPVD